MLGTLPKNRSDLTVWAIFLSGEFFYSPIFSVLYLYVEQFVHVGLPFVHRGIEKIKYSVILSTYHGKQIKLSVIVRQLRRGGVKTMDNKQVNKAPQKSARLVLQAVTAIARSNANSLCRGLLYEPKVPTQLKK